MRRCKHVILVITLLFFIQTVFAEMKAMKDSEMGGVVGQSGILGTMIGFSEAFASTGNTKQDLDKALSFNLAYVNKLKGLEDDIRQFDEIFQRLEVTPLEDGWSHFEMEYDSDEEVKNIGEQLTYDDVYSQPVESALGLFGLGGFKVETSGKTHIKMSGKVKIEFRP